MISKEQLKQIMPKATADNLEKYCMPLNDAMDRFQIDTLQRIAAFIAQIAHESGEFRAVVENLNYSAQGLMKTWPKHFPTLEIATQYAHKPELIANKAYGDRMGNVAPNDGWRFIGRGLIGITGKDNYFLCGQGIGADLLTDPSKLELPLFATASAAWFWNWRGLNSFADRDAFVTITKRINGGYIGLESRQEYWLKAKAVLL